VTRTKEGGWWLGSYRWIREKYERGRRKPNGKVFRMPLDYFPNWLGLHSMGSKFLHQYIYCASLKICRGESCYLNKEYYAFFPPVTALFLFFSVNFIYAALNSFTVPKLSSMDNIEDIHSNMSTQPHTTSSTTKMKSSLDDEIFDLDPSTLHWYYDPTQNTTSSH